MNEAVRESLEEKIRNLSWNTISELAMAVSEDPNELWVLLADELKFRLDHQDWRTKKPTSKQGSVMR